MIHFIPYVNNYPLLKKAYASCRGWKGPVVIIDNRDIGSSEPSPKNLWLYESNHEVFVPPVPLSTSQTMNLMWTIAHQHHPKGFFTWQHSDASFDPSCLFKLHEVAHSLTENWGVIHTYYDTLCAYRTEAITAINGWDYLRFHWYYLDNDLHIRLFKKGYRMVQLQVGEITHVASSTLNSSPERQEVNSIMYAASELLLRMKHPDYEQYTYKKFNYLEL